MNKDKLSEGNLKLNYKQTFIIGFGFLASTLTWAIYNTQVPLILNEDFLLSNTLIGVIMTIDNFFGVIFQPLIGVLSDNTKSSIGRRMPWIVVGLPLCALIFSVIPLQAVLWQFIFVLIAFNIIMTLWRSPVIALMPDVTPSSLRSEANGIINVMGGLGSIIALFFGGMLTTIGDNKFYIFFMGSIIMALALLILVVFLREPPSLLYRDEEEVLNHSSIRLESYPEDNTKQSSLTAFLSLPTDYKKSLLALLIAIFAWCLGNNAIEIFFTLYIVSSYGLTGGQATMMLAGFALSFLILAIPAGLIGKRIGRKPTILIGLIGLIIVFIPMIFQPSQLLSQVLLVIGGGFWALININAYPMVLEFASDQTNGSFTGYYYIFSFTAAIIGPILYGSIQDFFNTHNLLFVFAIVCFSIALVSMYFVKHGESKI